MIFNTLLLLRLVLRRYLLIFWLAGGKGARASRLIHPHHQSLKVLPFLVVKVHRVVRSLA
jgi:hypothetical protein